MGICIAFWEARRPDTSQDTYGTSGQFDYCTDASDQFFADTGTDRCRWRSDNLTKLSPVFWAFARREYYPGRVSTDQDASYA